MSQYERELTDARRRGERAHAAMEAWLNRPIDAPETPVKVIEEYARELRESRMSIRQLQGNNGSRDDIEAALARNTHYHRALGLSFKDEPDEPSSESDP